MLLYMYTWDAHDASTTSIQEMENAKTSCRLWKIGNTRNFVFGFFFLLYSRHTSFCLVILFLNSEDIHATALPGWKTFYSTCSMLPSALWKKGHNQRLHWLCVIFPHNRELIQKTRHIDLRSLLFSLMAKISLSHKRATQYFQDQE